MTWRINLITILIIGVFYGVCENAEWFWFRGPGHRDACYYLHIARGLGTSLLITALLAWNVLIRWRSPFRSPDKPFLLMQCLPDEVQDIRNYCYWFANLRWVAVLGALSLTALCCFVLNLLPRESFAPLAACLVALIVFNIVLLRLIPTAQPPYRLIVAQAVVDLVLLTILLHFSGGLENPLFTLYVLHVIIGSILLEKRDARRVLALSCTLLALLAVEQALAPVCHHHIKMIPASVVHTPVFALGIAGPYIFIMICTAYILAMVKEQLSRTAAERQDAYEQLIRQEKIVVLGEVAAGVAHEINNPLQGVQNCMAMVRNDPQDIVQVLEYFPLMEEGLNRIAMITHRLLLHSRKETLPMRETDLNAVLEESIKFIEYRARQQGTELCTRFDPALPLVAAESRTLSEVFINLLVNALDAVEKGGMIEVGTAHAAGKADSIEVWVKDSGCGIPAGNLELIFHPFFTTKPVGKGSGLGLSISKRIVEDHQGTIRAESEPGKGSRFVMVFPAFGSRCEPRRTARPLPAAVASAARKDGP